MKGIGIDVTSLAERLLLKGLETLSASRDTLLVHTTRASIVRLNCGTSTSPGEVPV